MATSSSSRCVCLDDGFSAPSRLPDLASLPEPVRLVTAENPREFLDSACSGRRFFSGLHPSHGSNLLPSGCLQTGLNILCMHS